MPYPSVAATEARREEDELLVDELDNREELLALDELLELEELLARLLELEDADDELLAPTVPPL